MYRLGMPTHEEWPATGAVFVVSKGLGSSKPYVTGPEGYGYVVIRDVRQAVDWVNLGGYLGYEVDVVVIPEDRLDVGHLCGAAVLQRRHTPGFYMPGAADRVYALGGDGPQRDKHAEAVATLEEYVANGDISFEAKCGAIEEWLISGVLPI